MKKLTPALREQLQKPFTTPIPTERALALIAVARAKGQRIIAVGDTVCAMLVRARHPADLGIYDFVSQRRRTKPQQQNILRKSPGRLLKAYNPPGYLSFSLTHAVKHASLWLKGKHPLRAKILVDGEEDLAVLPAIAYAPSGSLVIYGQPNQGVVIVPVTTTWKLKARLWLAQFKTAR